MAPANILGPFDGRVVDAETGEPVAQAWVSGSWRFSRGVGLHGPAGGTKLETKTDADGRYQLPALDDLPTGLSMTVSGFTLVIYKAGYRAYRSDRQLTEHGIRPRRAFAQRGHRVELRRLGTQDRHAENLALLGVWGAPSSILNATDWEVSAAHQSQETPLVRMLDVTPWLTAEDVAQVTGFAGPFEVRKLREPRSSEHADSVHLRATEKTERWDVALRVWSNTAEAEMQYQTLLRTYPGAVAKDEIADRSFRAAEEDILAVGWLDLSRGRVLALTCGVDLCPDHETLLKVSARIMARANEPVRAK